MKKISFFIATLTFLFFLLYIIKINKEKKIEIEQKKVQSEVCTLPSKKSCDQIKIITELVENRDIDKLRKFLKPVIYTCQEEQGFGTTYRYAVCVDKDNGIEVTGYFVGQYRTGGKNLIDEKSFIELLENKIIFNYSYTNATNINNTKEYLLEFVLDNDRMPIAFYMSEDNYIKGFYYTLLPVMPSQKL